MLTVKNLEKGFKNFKVDHVSFHAERGGDNRNCGK